jgi:hypothetical protein
LWRCQYIGIYFNRPRYFSNTQFFTVESNAFPLQKMSPILFGHFPKSHQYPLATAQIVSKSF